jgi:hypothetical protein
MLEHKFERIAIDIAGPFLKRERERERESRNQYLLI